MRYELFYWASIQGRREFVAPPFLRAGRLLIGQTANILLYLGEQHGLPPRGASSATSNPACASTRGIRAVPNQRVAVDARRTGIPSQRDRVRTPRDPAIGGGWRTGRCAVLLLPDPRADSMLVRHATQTRSPKV